MADTIKVNLSGVSAEGPAPVPENDWYKTRVTGFKPGLSGSKKPKIDIEWTIIHGVEEDDEDYKGRKLFQTASLQKQALFTIKRFLLATEMYDEDELDGRLEIEPDEILEEDLEMWLYVGQNRTYNGREYNQVVRMLPGSLDADELEIDDAPDEDDDDDEEEEAPPKRRRRKAKGKAKREEPEPEEDEDEDDDEEEDEEPPRRRKRRSRNRRREPEPEDEEDEEDDDEDDEDW